jgi:hypothetical protein
MSQQPLAHPQTWSVVYVAYNEPEALIVAGRLENEGIETFVNRERVGNTVYGIDPDPWSKVNVLVHPADYDQASAILEEDMSDDLSDDGDEADENQPDALSD